MVKPPKRDRRLWRRLEHYLLANRSHGLCEVCGNPPNWLGLSGAHCVRRSRGLLASPDKAWNVLLCCSICHDHNKYGKTGLPLSQEEALARASELNSKYGIDPNYGGE